MASSSRAEMLVALLVLLAVSGCTRSHYRQQADAQASALIREKSNHPLWQLEDRGPYVDPRSRMFDPFDPDGPPMPPDDPVSHEFMHQVDGKHGYTHWDDNGETPFVENPDWTSYLPLDEAGVLRLGSEQAYQLALLHSTQYQEEFEELFLSALDVSAERFRFDTQLFGGYSAFYTANGRERHPPASELDVGLFTNETGRIGLPGGGVRAPSDSNLLLRRGFVTGADLAAGIANSLVWNFGGANTHSAFTLLDLSIVQPLLRQAGRDRILEQLTIAERTLLANVREIERFRRGYFVEIMTGDDAGQGAQRRGGFFGAAGLGGFTGVGGGGFGGVGGGGFGGAAQDGFGAGGAGAAQVGGFLGLLQSSQDIRNQQVTIVGLRTNLSQLRESLRENLAMIPEDAEFIIRDRLQVAQARQALLNAESRLLNSQAAYQLQLDVYKRTLGLPPKICVHVDDPMVSQFNLVDSAMLEVQSELTILREAVARLNDQLIASAVADGAGGARLPRDDRLQMRLARMKQHVHHIREIIEQTAAANLGATRDDIQQLAATVPNRRQLLLSIRDKFLRDPNRFAQYDNLDPCQMSLLADIDPSVFDVDRLEAAAGELEAEVSRIEQQFSTYLEPLSLIESFLDRATNTEQVRDSIELAELQQQVVFKVPSLLSDLADDVLDLSLVQARARTDAVSLTPIDLGWDVALEIARQFRRDWMNRRAALVDAWRLIEFNADNLESTLDIVFDGELQNIGDNPARIRDINGHAQLGLRFDAPLTRLQERNTYRQALIEYQQARRDYYRFEDFVSLSLRNTVRLIELNQVNFEERRIAVLSAIDQVVLNNQIQKLREERGQEAGVTAARDVVSALADLQTAQNDFLSVWLNYESQRLNLDRDLGTMNLDHEGNWIDPGPIGADYGYPRPFGLQDLPEMIIDPSAAPQGGFDELEAPPAIDVFDAAAHPAGNPDILWAPGLGKTEVLPVGSFARLPPTTPSAIRH
jgi:hypothetical protein